MALTFSAVISDCRLEFIYILLRIFFFKLFGSSLVFEPDSFICVKAWLVVIWPSSFMKNDQTYGEQILLWISLVWIGRNLFFLLYFDVFVTVKKYFPQIVNWKFWTCSNFFKSGIYLLSSCRYIYNNCLNKLSYL